MRSITLHFEQFLFHHLNEKGILALTMEKPFCKTFKKYYTKYILHNNLAIFMMRDYLN